VKQIFLCFELLSDAAFSKGDGLAGEVDSEIQHNDLGCPYLNGRAIKGILVNECANILSALPAPNRKKWEESAQRLFGLPGQLLSGESLLKIDDAHLPKDLREALACDLQGRIKDLKNDEIKFQKEKFRSEMLQTLTTIRTQTAIDDDGVAKEHSLRSRRVIYRGTPFESSLIYFGSDENQIKLDFALLSACVASFRRAGSNRNRGLGKLKAWLEDENREKFKTNNLETFIKEVEK